jgi:AhpD family alkylhydroperoxidase
MSHLGGLRRQQHMSTHTHTHPRIDITQRAGRLVAALVRVEQTIDLDDGLRLLVKLRASQINGCAHCIDMHWTEARAHGESELRLAQLAAWAESPYFDERERAALTLTDAVTNVASTHVPDEAWAAAEAQFEPDELANLLFAIATINAWNRLAIATRAQPASYSEELSRAS